MNAYFDEVNANLELKWKLTSAVPVEWLLVIKNIIIDFKLKIIMEYNK